MCHGPKDTPVNKNIVVAGDGVKKKIGILVSLDSSFLLMNRRNRVEPKALKCLLPRRKFADGDGVNS